MVQEDLRPEMQHAGRYITTILLKCKNSFGEKTVLEQIVAAIFAFSLTVLNLRPTTP
jgi:hypothetical protein